MAQQKRKRRTQRPAPPISGGLPGPTPDVPLTDDEYLARARSLDPQSVVRPGEIPKVVLPSKRKVGAPTQRQRELNQTPEIALGEMRGIENDFVPGLEDRGVTRDQFAMFEQMAQMPGALKRLDAMNAIKQLKTVLGSDVLGDLQLAMQQDLEGVSDAGRSTGVREAAPSIENLPAWLQSPQADAISPDADWQNLLRQARSALQVSPSDLTSKKK